MSCRAGSSVSALRSMGTTVQSTATRQFGTSTAFKVEMPYYNPWRYRTAHLAPAPSLPNPLPRLHAQQIVMADGSTFTQYTTAPSPVIIRMTRDLTNNPLWAPGSDGDAFSNDEDGRVSKFRRRFEGMDFMASAGEEAEAQAGTAKGRRAKRPEVDLSWMEGGTAEKAPPPKMKKAAAGKGKRK